MFFFGSFLLCSVLCLLERMRCHQTQQRSTAMALQHKAVQQSYLLLVTARRRCNSLVCHMFSPSSLLYRTFLAYPRCPAAVSTCSRSLSTLATQTVTVPHTRPCHSLKETSGFALTIIPPVNCFLHKGSHSSLLHRPNPSVHYSTQIVLN